MEVEEVRESILKLRFLSGLESELCEKLADILQRISAPRHLPIGAVFIREGEHTDNKGYILLTGAALIRKEGFADIRCKAPELLGEIMQFNPAQTRTATVAGAAESIVLRFVWDDFWREAETDLTEGERGIVRDALETQAWEHFLR